MNRRNFFFGLVFLFLNNCFAQDSLTDPLSNYTRSYEIGFSLVASQVVSESTIDDETVVYKIDRRVYFVPDYDFSFTTGWLHSKGSELISMEKTGLIFSGRTINMPTQNGEATYNVSFVSLPVQLGLRFPLNHSTSKNGMFRAVEFYGGMQVSTPLIETFYGYDEFNPVPYGIVGKYLKFGFNAEIIMTSLNEAGHGHRYGIRLMTDLPSFIKTGETKYELFPVFSSIGLFYNLNNRYR